MDMQFFLMHSNSTQDKFTLRIFFFDFMFFKNIFLLCNQNKRRSYFRILKILYEEAYPLFLTHSLTTHFPPLTFPSWCHVIGMPYLGHMHVEHLLFFPDPYVPLKHTSLIQVHNVFHGFGPARFWTTPAPEIKVKLALAPTPRIFNKWLRRIF